MGNDESEEGINEVDEIKSHYMKAWKAILGNLLGWSEDSVQKKYEDLFDEAPIMIAHERAAHWIAGQFIPIELGDVCTWRQLDNLKVDIEDAIHGRDGRLNVLDNGYDWQAASKRIEKAVQEFKQSIADSK
jgi:hypothetical protein